MEVRHFHDRFEKANKKVAQKVRRNIQADVDQRKFEEGKPLCFMLYHTFLIQLLPLDKYPDEFKHLYSEAVFDIDMKDDLERTKVINWCRTIQPLYPIKTTADGNCLANAISQALWGVEDTDTFLRRLLYVTMTTDPKGRFKRRWLTQQRAVTETVALGLRLNTEQFTNEWEDVIRATTDVGNDETVGMPYAFLESIHLYIFANILRRPIILLADKRARNLYGESIQESDIGGIYLPLEWNPGQCEKSPIVIGYNMNHFVPLIGQEAVKNEQTVGVVKVQACPLVTNELESLKFHFLLPDEESKVGQLLMQFLQIEEVVYSSPEGFVSVLCARLTYKPLADKLNVAQEHRKDCERKFRNQVDEDVGLRPQHTEARVSDTPPFQFEVRNQNDVNIAAQAQIKPSGHKAVQPTQVATGEPGKRKQKHCSVVGCKMYGSPEFNGLCSKCFSDFTRQYAQDEAASRLRRTLRPNIAPPVISPESGYNDLSIMGENCQTGCGFKCSVETFPYCHECYPKQARQGEVTERTRIVENVEMSMMPENCIEPNCRYRASKQTFPYCHQCYDNHVPKAQPTAPPVSVHEENMEVTGLSNGNVGEPDLQLRIEEEPETNLIEIREPFGPGSRSGLPSSTVGEQSNVRKSTAAGGSGVLDRKCRTGGCLNSAIKGNDGFCDKCYDQSLFGEGDLGHPGIAGASQTRSSSTCKTTNCKERPASGCNQCLECFLKEGTIPSTSEISRRQLEELISNSERPKDNSPVKSPLHAAAYTRNWLTENVVSAETERLSRIPRESIAVEEVGNFIPVAQSSTRSRPEGQRESTETHRKYICAKPGCTGIRIDATHGFCYECSKVGKRQIEKSAHSEGNNSPKNNDLNVSEHFISETPFLLSEEQLKEMYPVVVSSKQKVKCAAAICENMIYPPNKLCEDCTTAIQKSHAEKLKSGEMRHTAPIATSTKRSETKEPQRYTVPIVKARSKLCIEKDCERYGDPAQKDRCSRHYNLATRQFREPSPPGVEPVARNFMLDHKLNNTVLRNAEVGHHNNVPVVPAFPGMKCRSEPVQNGDELTAAMYKIENSWKSKVKCKNAASCGNYANPAKSGFCNQCFDAYPVQTLLGHPRLPGRNQID